MVKRVVLDTNQVIQAGSRWVDPLYDNDPNPAVQLIRLVATKNTGLYTGKIMGEYLEKLLDLNHPPERVDRLIGLLMGAFEMILIKTESCNPAPKDPDDEVFLLCAIDGLADLLVSNDNDLLELKDQYTQPSIVDRDSALSILNDADSTA